MRSCLLRCQNNLTDQKGKKAEKTAGMDGMPCLSGTVTVMAVREG